MTDEKYKNTFEDPSIYIELGEQIGHWAIYKSELENNDLLSGVDSLISIGVGEGRLESALAKEHGIKLGYIDPSQAFGEIYLNRLRDLNCENKNLELIQKTLQDAAPKYSYDLVLSIHSWYAFGYNKSLLEKAIRMAKSDGKIFIGLAPKVSANHLLTQVTGELSGQSVGHEGMIEKLSEWNIPHKHWMAPHRFPIETFLNGDQLTPKSESFVQFLIGMPFSQAREETQRKVIHIINEHTKDGCFEILQGCILIEKQKMN